MRYKLPGVILVLAILSGLAWSNLDGQTSSAPRQAAPQPPSPQVPDSPLYNIIPPAPALYKLDDAFLRWPLPADGQKYGAIDGKRVHRLVVEQSLISRRFRDQGHPQYWGRPIGSTADAESAQWLEGKFKQAGLSDVHIQDLPIPTPVWEPVQPWDVTATSGDRVLKLTTAHPPYQAVAAPPGGLDVEAVYVGMGSEAEFASRDVRGKAVVIYSIPFPGGTRQTAQSERVYQRAVAKGAAAILAIFGLPGNFRTQAYPVQGGIPMFALGMEDGYRLRDQLFAGGQPVRIKINFQIKTVPGLKTATVWGTLPGATDETIFIMAHRDGWFDAAGDNASGVATMIALAEYYSKVPVAQRRRTMRFIGVSGHHGPNMSAPDLQARKDELFAKTALFINSEHTSTLLSMLSWESLRLANTYTPQFWYAGGPSRPKLQDIAIKAFRDFGVTTYAEPERNPPPGDLGGFARFVPGLTTSDFYQYFHSDGETPETVPWTGLEATTRSYAKIIDEVNKLDLSDLKRPEEPAPTAARPTRGQ
jgi:Peptidase family M28